jgi:E3 ubiquitin ligase
MSGSALTLLQALIIYSGIYSGANSWLWAFGGLGFGAYCFYRGFILLARRNLILDTPASKIRSASIGLVELSGLAGGPYTLRAPLTGMPCYYYRTLAWQLKQSGKNSHWEKVADEALYVPFYLDDNSAKVLVDPQGAELDLHRDFQEEFRTSFFSTQLEVPGNAASFLLRHGIDTDKKLKLEEYAIKPKNALFVLGTLAPNPGIRVSATPVRDVSDDPIRSAFHLQTSPEFATSVADSLTEGRGRPNPLPSVAFPPTAEPAISPETIRLQGGESPSHAVDMNQQQKLAAALMKAGITNPAAWDAAGVEYPGAGGTAVATSAAGGGTAVADPTSGFDLNPKTVLLKGENNRTFFISWRSQRNLAQSLGVKSRLMIWGGPALTLLSLYWLLAHFGWM